MAKPIPNVISVVEKKLLLLSKTEEGGTICNRIFAYHSSEIKVLCSTFCPWKMLENMLCLCQKKSNVFIFQSFTLWMQLKVAANEKRKKTRGVT